MAEFKKLSEVDLLETSSDNTTVLVEDGGEIKRVPKKEVGGAGGYVVTLTPDNVPTIEGNQFICLDNYDEMYDVLMAGGSVYLDATAFVFGGRAAPTSTYGTSSNIPSPTNFDGYKVAVSEWFMTDLGLGAIGHSSFMDANMAVIFPNGSHNLESLGGDR